ncbi:MAG: FliH/SctL family protein [Phycisphaerae bacterium]
MSGVIIKAGESRCTTRGLYGLELRDIAEQADAILASARAEAETIVHAAQSRAQSEQDTIHRAAHRAGYEKGMAEGRSAGHDAALAEARERFSREQATLVSALTKLVENFDQQREQLYAAARRDVVVLAIAIGTRISERFALMENIDTGAAEQACGEALRLVEKATNVVIRTHPEDAVSIRHLSEQLETAVKRSRHVRIVDDESVDRGGVTVAAADGKIDASIQSRVRRIADELVTDWRERMKALSIES